MIEYRRTDSSNTDFQSLVVLLDKYLSVINGEKDSFFAAFNTIDTLQNVIVAYDIDKKPVGCGAFKPYSDDSAEIKRMFVPEESRGQGIAQGVLAALETWASELGFGVCILETSKSMLPAVRLYEKCGYSVIPNYGQYHEVETSVCMQKHLR
jgi:GNAT superfamily N-acetyltransferase